MAHQETILWSRLIHNSWRQEFRCPDELVVTNEEFAAELSATIADNRIPAEVNQHIVNWDDVSKQQTRILIRYIGPDVVTDVLRYMVGVDQMGRFSYIEEKTYFAPPELPPAPRKEKNESSGCTTSSLGLLCLLVAAVMFWLGHQVMGLFTDPDWSSWVCCAGPIALSGIGGFLLLIIGISEANEAPEIERWNAAAKAEAEARQKAWEEWQASILTAMYLSRTDDTLGRFVEAIRSTVAEVTQKLFVDQNAELVRESKQESTREEIEEELKRRHAALFG